MTDQKTAEPKLTLAALAKRIDAIDAALSALADHVENAPHIESEKGGDGDLMAHVKYVLEKYYHNDRPN